MDDVLIDDLTLQDIDDLTEFLLSDNKTDSNINTYDLPKFKKAKNAINNGIRAGTIKKPGVCSTCGSLDRIEAHHKNGYEEGTNFDIKWLCRDCHLKAHVKLNAAKKKELKKGDSVIRFDVFDITEANMTEPFVSTPEGYLKGRAIITNTGIFNYKQSDRTILRELRTPEDIGDQDSLNSFKNIIITSGHPKDAVDSNNAKKLQVGFTGEDVQFDGHAVSIGMTITDGKTIDEIRSYNKIAISAGYRADLEMKSGFAFGNNKYDLIQRNIRANHIAVNIDIGRAGDLAKMKLRMDSTDAIRVDYNIKKLRGNTMAKVKINDVEFEADQRVAEEFNLVKKDNEDLKVKIKDKDIEFSKLQADSDSSKDKLTSANDEIEKLKKEAMDESKIQEAVKNRIALVDIAVKQEIKIEETMNDNEIKKAIIVKAFPTVKLEEKNDVYIDASFDLAKIKLAEKVDVDNKIKILNIKPDNPDNSDSIEEKRKLYLSNEYKLSSKQADDYRRGIMTDEMKSILGGK